MQHTKKQPGGKVSAPQGDLAALLSAVLQHPDIPVNLHTHIGDWIVSYGNAQLHEPARIRRALAEWSEDDAPPENEAATADNDSATDHAPTDSPCSSNSAAEAGQATKPKPNVQPDRVNVEGITASEPEAIALAVNFVRHTDLGSDDELLDFLLLLHVLAYHPDHLVRESMLQGAIKEAAPCLVSFGDFMDSRLARRMAAVRAGGEQAEVTE